MDAGRLDVPFLGTRGPRRVGRQGHDSDAAVRPNAPYWGRDALVA
jgi:hypothetical protein